MDRATIEGVRRISDGGRTNEEYVIDKLATEVERLEGQMAKLESSERQAWWKADHENRRAQRLEEQLKVAQRSAQDEREATERFWNENARLKEQLEAQQRLLFASDEAFRWIAREWPKVIRAMPPNLYRELREARVPYPAKHPYPDGYPDHLTADAHDWEPPPYPASEPKEA